MNGDVLSTRVLNRAVLERQMLLRRVDQPVVGAVERLLGLNAQDPNPPYIALWNRLEGLRSTTSPRPSTTGRWCGRR